jgi:valyl-tRNA synthetase
LGARAFANKIWNAARFLFMNLEKAEAASGITLDEVAAPNERGSAPWAQPDGSHAIIDLWIFGRLSTVLSEVNDALENFRFHEACQAMYHFFWGDFCDWYIEWVKPQLSSQDRDVAIASWRNIFAVLDAALRLLHPVMPFLTEELWHKLPQPEGARSIALDRFPTANPNWVSSKGVSEMRLLQEIIIGARNIRAEMKVDPKRKVPAEISVANTWDRNLVEANLDPILRLANLSALMTVSVAPDSNAGAIRSTARFDLRIGYDEVVDKQAEIARLKKEIERLAKDIESKNARLADEAFLSKAPAKIVEDLKATLAGREIEYQKLLERLKQLE